MSEVSKRVASEDSASLEYLGDSARPLTGIRSPESLSLSLSLCILFLEIAHLPASRVRHQEASVHCFLL